MPKMINVGKTMSPPVTGNGNHTTDKNGDDWGMVLMTLFYPYCINLAGGLEHGWMFCPFSWEFHHPNWLG